MLYLMIAATYLATESPRHGEEIAKDHARRGAAQRRVRTDNRCTNDEERRRTSFVHRLSALPLGLYGRPTASSPAL